MFKRTGVALAVILGLALSTLSAGCGESTGVGQQETTTSSTGLATHISIDVGSAAEPIVVEKVVVAESVKTFVPPAALSLYEKKVEHPLSSETMEELAGQLGLSNLTLTSQSFRNEEYSVEFAGGGEATCFTLQKYKPTEEYATLIERGGEVPPMPSDDEVTKMADEQLRRLGLGMGLERTSVFIQESVTAGDVTYDLSKGVGYRTKIDGFPLLGPGAKIYMTFGPRGELLRIAHWVMPSVKGPEIRLRQLDLALDDLKAGKGLPPGTITPESAREISVTDVSLAYWAEPLPMQEKYYKPVFVFTVVDKDGKSGSWVLPAFEDGGE
jgi:hypothetical protein